MKWIKTPLEAERINYIPPLPDLLHDLSRISLSEGVKTAARDDVEQIADHFPHTFGRPTVHFSYEGIKKEPLPLRVGVVLSGGQAPGGHNVISGLFDALKKLHPGSLLFGFLGGPIGIVNNDYIEIAEDLLADYRNTGGFDLLGSGRTKIKTEEQLSYTLKVIEELELDGLVIIGGEGSNAYVAVLAEYLLSKGCKTCVVGVPKTIDGDLRAELLEISFGFDTACKIYAELIGNIERDAISSKKYYHFIKLMGRTSSHITLECALQTHPNIALICEEVAAQKKTLEQIVSEIADVIYARAERGKDYGVVVVPEGLIEFVPQMKELIEEINRALPKGKSYEIIKQLSLENQALFAQFPEQVRNQLLFERDVQGNVKLSHIATEQLLIEMIRENLHKREGFKGNFITMSHFFGYEGRSGFPSNFDASYCIALGHVAALLVHFGCTGYMALCHNLPYPIEEWKAAGIPITMLMAMEKKILEKRPLIPKSLVDLDDEPFVYFAYQREMWALEDDYRYPGPIQFGPSRLTEQPTFTLLLKRRG